LPNQKINVDQYLSEHTKELLQNAGQIATKYCRKEIQTEHLLYAISESEVILEIFKEFNLNTQDLKSYIEEFWSKNTKKAHACEKQVPQISSGVKNLFQLALRSTEELGHTYIGPEHLLLIACIEDETSLAGTPFLENMD
jgi:ATP-dependent Clp protease ATP-binding subunit ClpC